MTDQLMQVLKECSVNNFKEHPVIKQILEGDIKPSLFPSVMHLQHILLPIDNIGREIIKPVSGACLKMAYNALKILEANPVSSIVEIGGGVGQFYAVLRALGYEGEYGITDPKELQDFQRKYLAEVEEKTGLKLPLVKAVKPDLEITNGGEAVKVLIW